MQIPSLVAEITRRWLYIFSIILAGCLCLQNVHGQILNEKKILILGDSLSAGYGIPLEDSWVNLLQTDIAESDYLIVNASISGETTDGGLRALPKLLEIHRPEIVVIELGANDGLRGFPINTIRQNLSSLIQLSQEQQSKVLLLGMHIPPNYGKRYANSFHQMYHDLSKKYETALLPFLLEDVAIHDNLMQDDRLHPKSEGQPIIKDNVKQQLLPLL